MSFPAEILQKEQKYHEKKMKVQHQVQKSDSSFTLQIHYWIHISLLFKVLFFCYDAPHFGFKSKTWLYSVPS